MRARSRLGVVLHREGRDIKAFQPLDDVVVEPDVGDTHPPVCRVVASRVSFGICGSDHLPLQRGVHREPVILGCDLDLPGGAVDDGLVDAAVAVLELVGLESQRPAEQLVAETDSEERQPAVEDVCVDGL